MREILFYIIMIIIKKMREIVFYLMMIIQKSTQLFASSMVFHSEQARMYSISIHISYSC